MGEGADGEPDGDNGEEPVRQVHVAAYILEMAGALVIAAREAGLTEIAETLTRAQTQSAGVLSQARRRKRAN